MRKINIEGFDGYQITDDGKVWSEKTNKYIKLYDNGNGYLYALIRKNGKTKYHLYIHRLVATAFVENPQNKTVVGHKDCDTKNNNWDNLYWCSQEENNQHPITRARRSKSLIGKLTNHPSVSKKIYQYSLDGKLVAIYPSTMEAERNGYHAMSCRRCARGERKTYKGYKWSYIPL